MLCFATALSLLACRAVADDHLSPESADRTGHSAAGAGDPRNTPSNQILVGLALFLTAFVMMPVLQESYERLGKALY